MNEQNATCLWCEWRLLAEGGERRRVGTRGKIDRYSARATCVVCPALWCQCYVSNVNLIKFTNKIATKSIIMALYPFLCLVFCLTVSAEFVWKHHNNEELPLVLEEVHQKCPNISRIYALTEPSVCNVPLYVIEFSDTPGFHQPCKFFLRYLHSVY